MNFQHLCGPGKTAEDRFPEYLMPIPDAGCFIWIGEQSHNGYGRFRVNGRRIPAHRFAWTRERGAIPPGLMVCHKCDTPACCNPNHLFLGTCEQNKADSVRKGRHSRGRKASEARRQSGCRLTQSAAMQVYLAAGTHQEIADRFGIGRQTVTKIKSKRAWAWIHDHQEIAQ